MDKQEQRRLELEHEWREILQAQLAEHYLSLYCPEEPKEKVMEKVRGEKVA